MKRWLYKIHRWVGVALALFMFMWFGSGLVIMYAGSSALSAMERLSGRELLNPESGWLSLGEVWERGAWHRGNTVADRPDTAKFGVNQIRQARLVRQAGQPLWLVEDGAGRRFALSALDGTVHETSAKDATLIAMRWVANRAHAGGAAPTGLIRARYLDTGPQDSSVRNQQALRPFHRVAVHEEGRELLISARTGEVVRDSTRVDRMLYWVGNYIHLLRPLDVLKLGSVRRDVLAYLAFFAFAGSLTGLIVGWLRWRPGWGGRSTYSQGRQHPYRDVWHTWHFWTGLIGGVFALLWAFSGFINSNPGQLFSSATPDDAALARYAGRDVSAAMRNWRPVALTDVAQNESIVELSWHRLGNEAVLLGLTRRGERLPQPVAGAVQRIDQAALLRAVARMAGDTPVAGSRLLTDYDSYYYPRHHQGLADKPLPVLRVDLNDEAGTRFYLDPQDGRLLLRQDRSRRLYRWLYSALHHWDFGWLYQRPLWDAWMLTWALLGVVLGASSAVLGYKRLQVTITRSNAKVARAKTVLEAPGSETQPHLTGGSQPR